MHRRQFLTAMAVVPITVPGAGSHQVRKSQLVGGTPTQIIASVHFTARSAEQYRRSWNTGPFENYGEFYVDSSEVLELPPHLAELPGTLKFYTATVGAAAQRTSYMVAAFRRNNVSYIVRLRDSGSETAILIGDFFAQCELPTLFEATWNDTNLAALIPTTESIGVRVEQSDLHWP